MNQIKIELEKTKDMFTLFKLAMEDVSNCPSESALNQIDAEPTKLKKQKPPYTYNRFGSYTQTAMRLNNHSKKMATQLKVKDDEPEKDINEVLCLHQSIDFTKNHAITMKERKANNQNMTNDERDELLNQKRIHRASIID